MKSMPRSMKIIVSGLLAIFVAVFVTITPASATLTGTFRIISFKNDKCIEVGDGGDHTSIGVHVQQWQCLNGLSHQYWSAFVVQTNNGIDRQTFENQASHLCMEPVSLSNQALVIQKTCEPAQTIQQWDTIPVGGALQLKNVASGRCLDMAGNTNNGFRPYIYTCLAPSDTYIKNQQFRSGQ